MFTGIIETTATVADLQTTAGGMRLTIDVSGLAERLSEGDSLAVDGVCLTAVMPSHELCCFDVITETVRRSTLPRLQVGSTVNLERAMGPDSRFDGHFVQGHIDAVGTVEEVVAVPEEWSLWISCEPQIMPLVVPKGAVAVNGVSLTIADTRGRSFSVALVPTTLQRTNLDRLQPGTTVNIETDILARTIHHQLRSYWGPGLTASSQPQDPDDHHGEQSLMNALKDQGFA